jgi:hypothetical protein
MARPPLGSLVTVSQHCIRDITFGDKHKTGHDAEGWRKEKLRLKTGKKDWAVFLNSEAALGQPPHRLYDVLFPHDCLGPNHHGSPAK